MRDNLPWVQPGQAGANPAFAKILENQWGWNIPKEISASLASHCLGAHSNAVINTFYPGAGGPVDWSNCRIHGFTGSENKWGIRAFDCWRYNFQRCTFDTLKLEHGCYLNALGGLRWDHCDFHNINGQAIQVVYGHPDSKRWQETGLADPRIWKRTVKSTLDEWHEVDRCTILDVGKPHKSERASFGLSFFEPLGAAGTRGHPVRIFGCYMQTSDPFKDPNGVDRDCAGAIMVHSRTKVQLLGNYIEFLNGDRDVVQLWDCGGGAGEGPDVDLRYNTILAKKPVDIRLHTPNDRIRLQRNAGTAEVVVSTNPWYVWESNGWDEKKVLYRGPINRDWSLNC